jgi:hypothetical protein
MAFEHARLCCPATHHQDLIPLSFPLIKLTDPEFITSIFRDPSPNAGSQVWHANKQERGQVDYDANAQRKCCRPIPKGAYHRASWYLATEFVASVIGTEKYSIPHVQGGHTEGYRLLHEKRTTIVALMRGGEPMAHGVNEAFPLAMFVHAREPEDIKPHHLDTQHAIVLVDSVVNNGKIGVEFVQ